MQVSRHVRHDTHAPSPSTTRDSDCAAALPGVRRYCHTGAEGSEPESPAKKRQNSAVTSLLRILEGFLLLLLFI